MRWLGRAQAGEIILVTRNIHVTAPRNPPGDLYYEGGHLGIFMTREPQALYGVEFSNLGQQGTLGRYPLHFHLCGRCEALSRLPLLGFYNLTSALFSQHYNNRPCFADGGFVRCLLVIFASLV